MSDQPPFVRLGDLTASAFAAAAKASPVILLPLGSHEDHGPHQPMGDYLLADRFGELIAQRATSRGTLSFVAPCLPYGVADYFGGSPGGLALAPETFRRILRDILEGLLRHGLTNIVILNAHGGNVPVIHEVTLAIRRECDLTIPSFYLWKVARQLMEQRIGAGSRRFGHGAEPLLALNLAERAAHVTAAEPTGRCSAQLLGLPVSGFGTLDFKGLTIEAPVQFTDMASDYVADAWAQRSVELGQDVAEALVSVGADFVVHFKAAVN